MRVMWVRKLCVSLVACAGLMTSAGTQEARACGWCDPCNSYGWRAALYTPVRVLYTPVRVVRSFFRGVGCYSPCDPCPSPCDPCASPCAPCATPCSPCSSGACSYYTPVTTYYRSFYSNGWSAPVSTACCGTTTAQPMQPVPQQPSPAGAAPMPTIPAPTDNYQQPQPVQTPMTNRATTAPLRGRISWRSLKPDFRPADQPSTEPGPRLLPAAPSLTPIEAAAAAPRAESRYQWKPVKKSVLTAERATR